MLNLRYGDNMNEDILVFDESLLESGEYKRAEDEIRNLRKELDTAKTIGTLLKVYKKAEILFAEIRDNKSLAPFFIMYEQSFSRELHKRFTGEDIKIN